MSAPASSSTPAGAPGATADAAAGKARRKGLVAIAALVAVAGIAWGVHHYLVAQHFENTDNAYVQANVVQITPQLGGTVLAILADDTDFVKAGQPLVRLDGADARVAIEQAEAQLAQTVREVRTLYANNATLQAQVALREADIAKAQAEITRMQAEVQRAQDDVNRRQPLLATGAVGREEFNHATAQLASARSALAGAESARVAAQSARVAASENLASNQVLTSGTTVEQHPNVQRAAARVREAWLAQQRTELVAPVDGYVARRSVQLGQRVQAGAPLMSVVALSSAWVDANFKEGQVRKLRIGQPVTLFADVYGEKVEYHGTVAGLSAGTGAAFALLPAQNATGNWIKVVQRVPVRIALDAKELQAHPLRVGLSMDATVDVTNQDGKMLADGSGQPSAGIAGTHPSIMDGAPEGQAEQQVMKIIAANLGRAPARAAVVPAPGEAKAPARTAATVEHKGSALPADALEAAQHARLAAVVPAAEGAASAVGGSARASAH
jgi:membrane fusion protein (multidrug efflux system)